MRLRHGASSSGVGGPIAAEIPARRATTITEVDNPAFLSPRKNVVRRRLQLTVVVITKQLGKPGYGSQQSWQNRVNVPISESSIQGVSRVNKPV